MVGVKLMGGLGNQMFQYAAALSLAQRLEQEVLVDLSFLQHHDPSLPYTFRHFELQVFKGSPQAMSKEQRLRLVPEETLFRKMARKMGVAQPSFEIPEPHFHYWPGWEKLTAPVYLSGYWQSEKYIAPFEKTIRSAFQFKNEPAQLNAALIADMIFSPSVAIHIRRGDYISNPHAAKTHPVCSLEYYLEGIRLVESQIGEAKFFIFSDDVAWAREHFVGEHFVFVDHNTGQQSFEDMRLMSHCKHHIIANSSFSWWGAWLAEHSKQIVVAPQVWFKDPATNTNDLIPSRWKRI